MNSRKKSITKLISLVLVATWLVQLFGVDTIAFGAAPYSFKGYGAENITSDTFSCSGATKDGTTITMTSTGQGEAIGFVAFADPGSDISTSIDLGELEMDFSTVTNVTLEGAEGAENDVPAVQIDFCSEPDYSDVISSVNLAKPNNALEGNVTLSSNASIPEGTRSLIIHLTGTNTTPVSSNTVKFTGTSFKIHDAADPACNVDYDTDWTNDPITVTITASDGDSGLEGIYKDGAKVSATSPYTFPVSANTSFSAYSKDYAGKTSEVRNITVNNIDTAAPSTPGAIVLSHDTWTNTDVSVTMPALGTSSGAPEKYIYSLNGGEWQDLPSDFAVTANGQHDISVALTDEAGNTSASVTDTIYIDKLAPSIMDISQEVSSGSALVTVTASDEGLSGLDKMKYAAGSQDASYFVAGGTDIAGGQFTITVGGTYTVYVSDKAGNYALREYGLSTAPTLTDITDQTVNEDTVLNVPVNVSDNETSLENLTVTASSSDTELITSVIVNRSAESVSIDITPDGDAYGGPAVITVEVRDESGEVVSDTFNVTVLSQNDAPAAEDDAAETDEDADVTIDVQVNDTDAADGDFLSITNAGTPGHGTAKEVEGKIVYTPDVNFNGTDSFTYTISDGNGGTASATVTVTVNEVNDAPAAADDTAATLEDTSVLIDVLPNDTDADTDTTVGETISLVSAANGLHGTAETAGNQVKYTPDANWFGKDSFTYVIQDHAGVTSTGKVTVTVTGVQDDPWFEGLESVYTIQEDGVDSEITFSIKDVETEAKSLMLQAVVSSEGGEELLKNSNIKISGLGDNLDAVTLKLTPEPNMFGDVTISLALGDGFVTETETFLLHIDNVNDAPTAKTDTMYFAEDAESITINTSSLIANDTDIDGDTLQFVDIVTTTHVGTLVAADETKTVYYYYPPAGFDGTDSFTYSVTDGTATVTGMCNLIAAAGNDAPGISGLGASYTTNEDTSKDNIEFNISDQESAASSLIVTAGSSNTDLISTDGITIVNNGDGTCTISITPMPDANGTAVITISVSDGNLKTERSFDFDITPVPDSPVAVNDYAYIPASGVLYFDVLLNDRDADGDDIYVESFDGSTLGGTLSYDNITHKFKYTARTGETGTATFTYVLTDNDPLTPDDTGTVTLNINAMTHSPGIQPIGSRYVMEDGSTGAMIFTVSDPDFGDELTVTAVSGNTTLVPESGILLEDIGGGAYSLTITPAADESGSSGITITATDLQLHTVTYMFWVYVYAQNDPPVAVNDSISTLEDNSVTLNLLSNDSDPEGESIWINSIAWPAHGWLSRSGNTYTYQPYGNFNGTETLDYWVSDGHDITKATVTITVTPVNDNPTARDDWYEIPSNIAGASGTISVLSNDYDVDGDTVKTVEIVTQGTYGTAVVNANGTITYTRSGVSPLGNGADSFTYSIIDRSAAEGDYLSDTATAYIGIDFISTLTCDPGYIYRAEDSAPITITLPIYNPNSVDYTLSIDGTTSLGTFEVIDNTSGNDTQVRFTPALNANGTQSVAYSVSGEGESDTSTIYVQLYPVNDAPTIDTAPATASCDEDSYTSFDTAFSDVDCLAGNLYFYAYTENAPSGGPVPMAADISVSRSGGNATVTVTPVANAFGSIDVVLVVSDGLEWVSRTVRMTVNPVDDAPMLSPANSWMYEDMSDTFYVVTPSSEVDGDDVNVSIAEGSGPEHGTAVVNANNTITYTPDENWSGEDILTFTVTDDTPAALSSTQTAGISVTPINDPPVLSGLNYFQTTNEDTQKTVSFDVADADNDLTGASSYTITSSNETLIPLSNISISHVSGNSMSVTLDPAENAYGTSVIGIEVTDGELTAYGEFQLTVVSVNDIPVAQDDAATVTEHSGIPAGTTSTEINLTGNDSDVEDATLKVVAISDITEGIVVNNKDGTVTYSVDGNFNGTATFNYTVMDKNGATDTAAVTVTVQAANDPPIAVNDSKTINEDEDVTIPVLANDSDAEGDTLAITNAYGCTHGTVTNNGTTVTYSPDENYYGEDSFSYDISDGNGGTDTAQVSIIIKPFNDAPALDKHSSNSGDWVMNEDETKAFPFVVSDPETPVVNLIITLTSLDESMLKSTKIKLASVDDYKTITVTPEENKNGYVDVRFRVTDGALTTEKVYRITILAVNDDPVISTPAVSTLEDTPVSRAATATDIDSEASALTYSKATDPGHGSVTVNANGTYTYTPSLNWSGVDNFDITVSDGSGGTDTGTVIVTVTPVNDLPTAVNDSETTPEDTPITLNVTANDIDPDAAYGDVLTVCGIGSAPHGSTSVALGRIVYTPDENWNGTDSFIYRVLDKAGKLSNEATVTITVTPVNDAPANGDDIADTDEDESITINVTANDDVDETTNPGLEDVIVTAVNDPDNGTAAISGDNKSIVYTPDANWSGTDIFTYTAKDAGNETAVFSVTVNVHPVNDAPVIIETLPAVTMNEDGTVNVTFTVQDVEDTASSLTVTATHNNGTMLPAIPVTAGVGGARSFAIAPKADKNGTAKITVKVVDSDYVSGDDPNGFDEQVFDVTVTAQNDVPVAYNDSRITNENTAVTVDVLANDDVDLNNEGDTITITSVSAPTIGTVEEVVVNGREQIKYTPFNNIATKVNGTEILTYTMQDGSGATSSATLTITVTPVNDAPTITDIADITGIQEDAPEGTGVVSFTVQDEEDDDDTLAVIVLSCDNTALFPLENITVLNPAGADGTRTVQAIPAANMFGEAKITLKVEDVEKLFATDEFTVYVNSENDDPADGNDTFTVTEDIRTQLDVLANDDVDGTGQLTISRIVTAAAHGAAEIAPDGKSMYYTTELNGNVADLFWYEVYDAYGDEYREFKVSIAVTPVNDAPVVTLLDGPGPYEVSEGGSVSDIRFSVTDVDDNMDCGIANPGYTITSKSSNPVLVLGGLHIDEETGVYRNLDVQAYNKWNGTTTITITAQDRAVKDGGLTGSTAFTFKVNSVNEAPVAFNDSFTVPEDQLTKLTVLANDKDEDEFTNGDTEFMIVSSVTDNDPNAVITKTASGDGVNIQPNANYNGPVTFTYVVEDAAGATSNTATVTVTVSQVNDAPVAGDDTSSTNEDNAVDIFVLGNDSDIDQQAGTNANPSAEVLSVSIDGANLLDPAHGSITSDGTKITYTPAANYNGTDSFEYNVDDGQARDKALVTVTIAQVNDNPVAVTDSNTTPEDTAVDIYPLANDTDVDTNASLNLGTRHNTADFSITTASLSAPLHGSLTQQGTKLTYTPEANFFGTQTATYTISDGHGGTATGTINITVGSINDLPVFDTTPATMNLTEDSDNGTANITVSDVETLGANLNVTVENSTNAGLLSTSDVVVTKGTDGERTITVNPRNNQNGSTVITLRVTDGYPASRDCTFTVNVAAVNDAPVAQDRTPAINEDASYTVDWRTITSDVDIATNSDALTITIEPGDGAAHGTAQVAGNNITYTPNANWNGVDSFTYTATDKGIAQDTGIITITVNQVNDAPVAVDDTKSTNEDTAVDIFVLSNDSDIDQDPALNAHPEDEVLSISIDEGDLLQPSHGNIAVIDKKIVYTPYADYNGPDSFEYNVDDGQVLDKALVTVTITQINDDPVTVIDIVTLDEDTSAEFYPLGNDTDVDTLTDGTNSGTLHNTSEFSITSAVLDSPDHGTLTQQGTKLTYTPDTNFFGADTATYTMSDGHGGTATGTITITVNSKNDLPVFDTTPATMELTEDSGNGTANFTVSDVETPGVNLDVTVEDSTNPGLVSESDVSITKDEDGDRTVIVNPRDNQNGTAVITLRVTDGDLATRDCTFTVNVAAVNDAPVAQDVTTSINEGSSYTVAWNTITSDADIATNSDALTVTIEAGDGAGHGTAQVVGGNITYTPNANWNGVDSFTYTVTDKADAKDTGVITITVNQVNDAPVAADDTKSTNEDTAADIYVLANDTDIDQQDGLNAHPSDEVMYVSIDEPGLLKPLHGDISTDGSKITYTPDPNYNGTDSFEYNVDDGQALDKALVTVTIMQVNDNPVAVADSATTGDEQPVEIPVLNNDTDVDTNETLNENELHSNITFSVVSYSFVGGENGTLSETGGVITFTPSMNFEGQQQISYVMSDGHGGTATGTINVNVDSENDAPEAVNDSITTAEDTAVSYNVLDNDTDQDLIDTKHFVSFTGDTSGLPGEISAGEDGELTFTPDADYHGSFSIGYVMSDEDGLTDTAIITITVTPVNDAPLAEDDSASTDEDTEVTVDVSGLISDADIATDGDTLNVFVDEEDGPQHGEISVAGTSITYTPDENWNGTDSFTYTVMDGKAASDTGLITITVLAVNDAPEAFGDTRITNEDTSILINVLANDKDIDTDTELNAVPQAAPEIEEGSLSETAHGSVSIEEGQIRYIPDEDYNGTDSFTYSMTDGEYTSQATVGITIKQVNDNPVANDDEATTNDEELVTIDVLVNDTDIDTESENNEDEKHNLSDLRITSAGPALHGTVTHLNGIISYTPADTFSGEDTFTYDISDGHGGTATGTVTVTVLSVNDAPGVVMLTPMDGGKYGGASTLHVTWNGTDIDGDELAYTLEYFNGTAWNIIDDELTAAEYDFRIPASLPSITNLQFRVKAFDGELESGWAYSGRMSVDKDVPVNIVVRMTMANGKPYTAGTWTNQNVTVAAMNIEDASTVTFSYALEDKAYAEASNKLVTNGVHNVYIKAIDEFGNTSEFGGYLIKIDKQPPATPQWTISVNGNKASVVFSLLADPGSSGNRYMILPDGTRVDLAAGPVEWSAARNGEYEFEMIDTAGNSMTFTVKVTGLDETPPAITCDSGDYVTGQTADHELAASLTFTDRESEIVEKGYAVDGNTAYSGAYKSYTGDITLGQGAHYIHAFAKNAIGLTAYETFGPFLVEIPGDNPDTGEVPQGDVVVDGDDFGDNTKVRLPDGEWSDSLVLESVEPGVYIVEVMDENGNVTTMEITITDEAIAAGKYMPTEARPDWYIWAVIVIAGLILLLLLLLWYNVEIEVRTMQDGDERIVRAIRKLKRKKDTVIVKLSAKDISGGTFGIITLKKPFTRRMEGNTLIVEVKGDEVLNVKVENSDDGFSASINSW